MSLFVLIQLSVKYLLFVAAKGELGAFKQAEDIGLDLRRGCGVTGPHG